MRPEGADQHGTRTQAGGKPPAFFVPVMSLQHAVPASARKCCDSRRWPAEYLRNSLFLLPILRRRRFCGSPWVSTAITFYFWGRALALPFDAFLERPWPLRERAGVNIDRAHILGRKLRLWLTVKLCLSVPWSDRQ
jgi:hypothetical protein